MFGFWKKSCLYALLLLSVTAHAKQTRIESLRYWTAPDYARIVFDVSSTAPHQIFLLDNPARLVIDFKNAKLFKSLTQPPANHTLFKRVRSAVRNRNDLRVVVDLKAAATPKSFPLPPANIYGHRLVVDMFAKNKTATIQRANQPVQNNQIVKTVKNKIRDLVIAIDAGHGGEDPGAHGPKGTQEKKVVFEIAKKLAAQINKKPGMKAVMVRKGDYFINLRKRMEIARAEKADLFVSIHADAFKNSRVKGASVFTLSNHGASSEAARWLAQHENAADLVGGVKLSDKEDMLATVLMDLSQTATKEASINVADKVLNNFRHIGALHQKGIQKAGFMVLKSPDIPSILVETAFISNPQEEQKLRSQTYQLKMANAIFNGVVSYFNQYAPAGTYLAERSENKASASKHVISRGETLSGIAQQYGISMRSLKSVNLMSNSRIRIGQVLKIPRG